MVKKSIDAFWTSIEVPMKSSLLSEFEFATISRDGGIRARLEVWLQIGIEQL